MVVENVSANKLSEDLRAYLKAEGFKAGASDLFIACKSGRYAGLWIEMKDEGKTASSVSDAQRSHLSLMVNMGYRATWCAGFESAREVIEEYMKPDLKICFNCRKEYKEDICEHCYK